MTKIIEVYFKNENDAQSAQAELRTLKVKKIYVEEMSNELNTELFVPFISNSTESSGFATKGRGLGAIPPFVTDAAEDSPGPNYPPYLLHAELDLKDWDQAMEILQKHDCYTNENE